MVQGHSNAGADMTHQDLPKVAVCIPSFDHVHTGFAMALAAMCAVPCARLALINHRSSLIHKSRDALVEEALKFVPDYVLFLDSDLKFPPWVLARLLEHEKDVVGASYIRRTPPHELLVKPLPGAPKRVVSSGLHEVALLPTGCLLIKADVFAAMRRPWFRSPSLEEGDATPAVFRDYITDDLRPATIGEDTYFCAVARSLGYKLWLDVDLTHDIGHIGERVFSPVTHTTQEAALAAPSNVGNALT